MVGVIVGYEMGSRQAQSVKVTSIADEKDVSLKKLEEVYNYLEERYVDEVAFEGLTDEAIHDALKALDPHSYYIAADEVKAFNDRLDGRYYGLGMESLTVDDRVIVRRIYPGTPASDVDVRRGDEILAIDSFSLVGLDDEGRQALMERFRAYRNREIQLTLRRSTGEVDRVRLTKSFVGVPSIDASLMVNEQTGYIRIKRFSSETYREFMAVLEDLCENQGMVHLIIDVRDNPGGYLKQVIDILSQFYDEKDVVLTTTQGINSRKLEYKSTGKPFYVIENIAVLINENSASGSEVLAGAIQDTDRGVIIGSTSFGKGLVQERYELVDGAEIRLTTSRYFTPSGRSIQKSYPSATRSSADTTESYVSSNGRSLDVHCGVVPDVYVKDSLWTDELERLFLSCYYDEAALSADSAAVVGLIRDCMISRTSQTVEEGSLTRRTILEQLPPGEAWQELYKTDPHIQTAIDHLETPSLLQSVLLQTEESL